MRTSALTADDSKGCINLYKCKVKLKQVYRCCQENNLRKHVRIRSSKTARQTSAVVHILNAHQARSERQAGPQTRGAYQKQGIDLRKGRMMNAVGKGRLLSMRVLSDL